LLKIDNEIITYTGITTNTFTGCIRGFSGITSYHAVSNQEELVFSTSKSSAHTSKSSVQNLSSLFLKEFYKKIKFALTPGLEDVDFVSDLNVGNFIKNSRSFYQSKGTDESFKILFNVLYGITPQVINLEDFLIKPSSAEYIRRRVVSAQRISGDPSKLVGQTITKSTDPDTNAPVSEVEVFTRQNKRYYKISLFIGNDDRSAIEGTFTITPNTKCLENVSIGASVISVDTTIGFSKTGTIISGNNTITYTGKSINQFLGCSGVEEEINSTDSIRSDEIYYGYENGDTTKKVELRITGVLSEFVPISNTFKSKTGEEISIKNLGEIIKDPVQDKSYKEIFANSWIYNTSSRYQIQNISGSTITVKSPINKSSLKEGDLVEIVERGTNNVKFPTESESFPYVRDEIENNTKTLALNNFNFTPVSGEEYDLRRKINKSSSSQVPIEFGNDIILSDIQNVYNENDEYMYVASNSLPSNNKGLNIPYAYQITKNTNSAFAVGLSDKDADNLYSIINCSADVPYITGDRIYYIPESNVIAGLTEGGSYYVEVQDLKNRIKLYASKSFIGSDRNLKFEDSDFSTDHQFILYSQRSAIIQAQKLLKKFPLNQNTQNGTHQLTVPGSIGMLVNGVEIKSYKSHDKIYYGPVKSVRVLNGGKNYDVVNPPVIELSAGIGITALIQPVISGKVEKVFIDPQEFDINSIVSIGVSGGNGAGCVLQPIFKKNVKEIYFDGRLSSNSGGVDYVYDTITFLDDHNLNNGQEVIYNSNGNIPIGIGTFGGSDIDQNLTLVNNSSYYVKIENNKSIKLYPSFSSYSAGINTIGFTEVYNSGLHKFSTISNKKVISEIKVINGGSGYQNRKLIVKPTGISTLNYTINFENHGFNSGDIITYNYQTSNIVGLSTSNQFYVLKFNDNSFRLCDAGIGGTDITNYNRKNYVKFTSCGSGYQYFSYPTISASISYTQVGLGTTSQQFRSINLTASVKGSIVDVYLYENGTGYGSTILNLHKKPILSVKNGREAQLRPVVVNGMIKAVNVQYGGYEYYSSPDLIIVDSSESGSGGELRPVISDGKITSVIITNPGLGYSSRTTTIKVVPTGKNAIFDLKIRDLTVNNNIKFGDELLDQTENGLQYSVCGYFNNLQKSFKDVGQKHSPIIGWAYDGNPIYGSYGYSDPEDKNSQLKILQPGYELNSNNINDRPTQFGYGFFVEDYNYTNSGDLDENNGRFGKTPEFPNGIYAYFAPIEVGTFESKFPYFIGDTYRSNFIEENISIDQSFDFNSSNLVRNTFPYKVSDPYADNDFLSESNEFSKQTSIIESVTDGYINSVDVLNSGSNYKVNDSFTSDDTGTNGGGLLLRVSSIKGKDILDLSTSVENYENAIFTWKNENQVNITILPNHNLSNIDNVVISGFSTNLSKLNGSYTIGVTSYYSNLIKSVPSQSAGVSTELYVSQIPKSVSIGSSIGIGATEICQVIEIFKDLSILKVIRGSTGISHTATSQINFIPDSFTISNNVNYFESSLNNKVYFNPIESIGIGTQTGITTSIEVQLGDSTITRVVPTQGIYIENHPFKTNQKVIFVKPDGAANISVSTSKTGTPSYNIPSSGNSQVLYIQNKNINVIGIKTQIDSPELFFLNNGSDYDTYSLISDYSQIIGKVKRIKTQVSVSTSHELAFGDKIDLNVNPNLSVGIGTSTSIYVKKNSFENILINPLGFNSTGINTTTNIITINSHNLNTGDKVFYSSTDTIASGLSTGSYFVYKVDDNNIKFSQTYYDSTINPPNTVSFASTGGRYQSISLVNPQIKVIKNNDLIFNLSDSSLYGYKLKVYYDQEFKNEFVSTASTSGFTVTGIGTVGLTTYASLTLHYSNELPTKLYYNLEKSGYISTADNEVTNYSEILFTNSEYTNTYSVSGIGSTTFNIFLNKNPEKLSYNQSECDILEYSTTSLTSKGPINHINIISGGSGYKKLPSFSNLTSETGKDAYIVAKSNTIGNPKEVRIVNEGFDYSQDKTIQPTAFVPPLVTLENSNLISKINVINGGKNYLKAPSLIVVDSETRTKIDNGILEAKLSQNSITSVDIIQTPKGLPSTTVSLFAVNNDNGISVLKVESSSAGIFTCFITTPILGFNENKFEIGDKVYIEGIKKISEDGSGFNSEDYGYEFLTISDYDNSVNPVKVEIDVSQLTSNTGIAKNIQDSFPVIIAYKDYPSFEVIQDPSLFIVGEKLISNGIEIDLVITSSDKSFVKVFGSYELSVGDIIKGKTSGSIASISKIESNLGKFKIDYSVEKNIGWSNDIGKLNQDNQVISDNDYYQNLSYTIKSPITYNELKTPVNNLVHTSGLKNFADTEIISKVSLTTKNYSTSKLDLIDLSEEHRVDTIYNFDLVKDVDIDTTNNSSKFLNLKNKKLSSYIECISNNVLKIDDIHRQFSNLDGEPSEYLNVFKIDTAETYNRILVRISDPSNAQIQLTEIVILNNSSESYILEKGSIFNSYLAYGEFTISEEVDGKYLQFNPANPYDYDYDVKVIRNKFSSYSAGIGTTSVGFVNLTSSTTGVNSGLSTSIFSVESGKIQSLCANVQIVDNSTNQMNFVELYLTHDGTNTYISEYYFDTISTTDSYSGNSIGSFGANISSGILSLSYNNNSSNSIKIRSKIVGLGTTSVGVGTYRFKLSGQINGYERTATYESKYQSNVSAASSIISLNKNDFNALKSVIKVGVGSTSSLHQVFLVQDTSNIYVEQSAFLSVGSTTGIGTFGGSFNGNYFSLVFYPDSNITSGINLSSFNECVYTYVDSVNIPPNLYYGNITESVEVSFYNAINGNRINRKEFNLTSDGYPIFAYTFDPTNSSILNPATGEFSIKNHFFSNGEKLIYTPKSTFIGVAQSAVGIGTTLNSLGITTNRLPSDVYVIKTSKDTFKLSTRKDYAQQGIGVTFTSYGVGNAHQLEMYEKNSKTIITIDNVIQYPITFTPLKYNLTNNGGQINSQSSIFALSGISSIKPNDILKIDNEYMSITNVGLGTTSVGPITNTGNINLVQVNRGAVGSSATSHQDTTGIATIYKGSYNIVGNSIFFAESPRGNPQIITDSSNLSFETADFTGRVYLRNNYTTNQIYDDISLKFTGIGKTFTLTSQGINTAGLGLTGGNGILLINGIFQTPTTDNNPANNFRIYENTNVGVSSVVFSGITDNEGNIITSVYDVNQNQLPRGGIIVSLGSSGGLGYAPLAGASVTAVVNSGSIISVGKGSTDRLGSGYNGIISIGVSVYQSGHTGTPASITATVGAGGTLSFNVANGGTGYTNPQIFVSPPSYQNLEIIGISRLGIGTTTTTGTGLLLDIEVGASSTTGIGSTYFEVKTFNITRQGYGFNKGDVFTPVGLVTSGRLSSPISQFKLTVIDTFSDSFASWQFGEFDYIDSIKSYQDGERTTFPLYYNSSLLSFEKSENSPEINMNNLLLIVINGVIQEPGIAYNFDGGTSFTFTTAPKESDNVAVFFYRGTKEEDSSLVPVNTTIKKGDIVQVLNGNNTNLISQNRRKVFDLQYSDKFETNLYFDQGIDVNNYKPLAWTKQKVDTEINGEIVYKSRDSIESQVYPTAKIIKDFSTTDTQIFLDNAQFFNYENLVSPNIKFNSLIVDPNSTNDNLKMELIKDVSLVSGFSGIVTGIGTTTGTGGNPLALKFFLRSATSSFSGLSTGYPIYIFDTSVGKGVTSINTSNSTIVGIGTTFLDNIYYVHSITSTGPNAEIVTNIRSGTSTVGIATTGTISSPIGKFSWGRLSGFTRSDSPISLTVSGNTVNVGLSTFSDIQRRGTGLRLNGSLPKVII
jgi:hypothetical protein